MKLCESIIESEEVERLLNVDFHLNSLESAREVDAPVRARMALIRAGRYAIAGDFLRASVSYLDAIRKEAFVNDENKKRAII